MGKDKSVISDLKTSTTAKSAKQVKLSRKTVLGSNTLALFITPSCVNNDQTITPLSLRKQVPSSTKICSPLSLFNMLKEVNRYMVKGTKVYESLKELHLCGWIAPYTLLLTGPAEDMKVVRHAWVKRYLKNPLGYFIKDVGIVQEFFVELLPQSPFLSLKTALFDAVADLNDQSVFPSKENLREYLKKHYPDVKLPEIKHVHECLGRLVRERRLYHNGCGYFILCNVNVLNELKVSPNNFSRAESTMMERFTISNPNSPVVTETDLNSSVNTSNSTDSSTERSFPKFLETNNSSNNNAVKNFLKKHIGAMKRQRSPTSEDVRIQPHNKDINILRSECGSKCLHGKDCNISSHSTSQRESNISPGGVKCVKEEEDSSLKKVNNEKEYPSFIGRENRNKHSNKHKRNTNIDITKTDNVYVHNHEAALPLTTEKYEDGNEAIVVTDCTKNRDNKSKLIRSLSFDGKVGAKVQKDVIFPVIGVPSNSNRKEESDRNIELGDFRRSFSFGAGSLKNIDKRKLRDDICMTNEKMKNEMDTEGHTTVHSKCNTWTCNTDDDPRNISPMFCHGINDDDDETCYDYLLYSDRNNLSEDHPPELLYNYENLGSDISFNKHNHAEYTVMDLSSPPICASLAEELKEVKIKDG